VILIISRADDPHSLCVVDALMKMGQPASIIDTARLALGTKLAFGAGRHCNRSWTSAAGEMVPMQDVRSVWHRRSYRPIMPDPVRDDRDRRFGTREWLDSFFGLIFATGAHIVNDPNRELAAVKPLQLSVAQEVGLRVPDTLITNDPTLALAFVERHDNNVVHKTITPPSHRFLPTKRWSAADVPALADLWMTPTIFQEAIECARELRVTVVGQQVFAARFAPRADRGTILDGRLDLDVPYERHELPHSVQRSILALVRALGLVYSTLDFKLTDEGEYVFLELNPAGQFLYIEILSGLPITNAMAELLAREPAAQPAMAAH
jgi:hypothetical protein